MLDVGLAARAAATGRYVASGAAAVPVGLVLATPSAGAAGTPDPAYWNQDGPRPGTSTPPGSPLQALGSFGVAGLDVVNRAGEGLARGVGRGARATSSYLVQLVK